MPVYPACGAKKFDLFVAGLLPGDHGAYPA